MPATDKAIGCSSQHSGCVSQTLPNRPAVPPQPGQNRGGAHHATPRAPDFPKLPPVHSAPAPRERLPSRRDATTLTESERAGRAREGRGRRRWGEEPPPPGRRARPPREDYDSQEDYSEEELEYMDRRPRRRREPEYAERRGHRHHHRPERYC